MHVRYNNKMYSKNKVKNKPMPIFMELKTKADIKFHILYCQSITIILVLLKHWNYTSTRDES